MPESDAPVTEAPQVDLSGYTAGGGYTPGAGKVTQILWYGCSLLLFESGLLPVSGAKRAILRAFGARIGEGVVIKPQVRIKFPWRLAVGEHTWIGQGVWIDNLAEVRIGAHTCVSQGVYLCTGSHDHRSPGFELLTRPITIGDGAWIAAMAVLLPGTQVGDGALAAAGSVVSGDVAPRTIVSGNPARKTGDRRFRGAP